MYWLYCYPNNASLAPHLALHEVGVEYELVLVDKDLDAHKSQEYLKTLAEHSTVVAVSERENIELGPFQ